MFTDHFSFSHGLDSMTRQPQVIFTDKLPVLTSILIILSSGQRSAYRGNDINTSLPRWVSLPGAVFTIILF